MTRSLRLATVAVALLVCGGPAQAQDHEKCYKIKDPVALTGIVDLTTPQFGLEPGCVIGRGTYFCAPASKTVVSATDKKTGVAITPLPVFAPPAPVDRICYRIKCPVPPPPFPPDQTVTDQFGTRLLSKFRASFVCTPAVKGAAYCGNGVIDPGEACDGGALGACTVGCQPDCTCTCPTTCCYAESLSPTSMGDTECFQYTGTPAQTASFTASCMNAPGPGPASLPLGSIINTAVPGPCTSGPIFGNVCVPFPPPGANLHLIPSDSSCP
jgi:hypothetical protein